MLDSIPARLQLKRKYRLLRETIKTQNDRVLSDWDQTDATDHRYQESDVRNLS